MDEHEAIVARAEVFKDAAGEWRYRAFAMNGEEVAASEEGHEHKYYVIGKVQGLFQLTDDQISVVEEAQG